MLAASLRNNWTSNTHFVNDKSRLVIEPFVDVILTYKLMLTFKQHRYKNIFRSHAVLFYSIICFAINFEITEAFKRALDYIRIVHWIILVTQVYYISVMENYIYVGDTYKGCPRNNF